MFGGLWRWFWWGSGGGTSIPTNPVVYWSVPDRAVVWASPDRQVACAEPDRSVHWQSGV